MRWFLVIDQPRILTRGDVNYGDKIKARSAVDAALDWAGDKMVDGQEKTFGVYDSKGPAYLMRARRAEGVVIVEECDGGAP
jgi:hypothetical protein